ncbi:MAG: DUF4249 domain-containing protein [Chitinophagaceae bacterium]
MRIIIENHILVLFFTFNLLLFLSCTKPINLDLGKQAPRLVVEGSVYSTPGPYLIRLTLSRNALTSRANNINGVTPVKDAIVIISDNMGNIDTLVAPPETITGYVKFYTRVGDSLILDSTFVSAGINSYTIKDGYYQTTHLIGIVGRTYYLKILYGGKEYTANETMPAVTSLDSVGVGIKYSLKEPRPYKVARLYFAEPANELNYYLAPTSGGGGIDEDLRLYVPIFSQRQCFQATLFDDRLLGNYVNGVFVDETCAREQLASDLISEWGNVYLLGLSKNNHDYIKVLFDQLKSDGGTYKPTPANPPTNLSNGALGYFGASAVSRKFYFFK